MLASVRRIAFAWVALVAGASAVAANVVTLENARYRVGVDLDRGGMVSSFVDKRGNAALNLVHGNGIQPTFRGNGYTAVVNAKPVTAYNFLSAGCSLAIANDNKVVNAENGQPLEASVWLQTICRTYDIESVRWFNMFPRTARFETLVVLKKKIT